MLYYKNIIFILFLTLCLSACTINPHQAQQRTAAEYNVQLGLGYLQQGDKLRARHKLMRAQQQAPDWPWVYLALAYYFEQSGQISAADTAYQRALNLAPEMAQAHNNYGVFLCQQNKADVAISHFLQAAQDPYYALSDKAFENAKICALMVEDPRAFEYVDLALPY